MSQTNSYPVGEILVDQLVIISARGTFNLTRTFVSASIYESILTPGTFCEIKVTDDEGAMGRMVFSGDETVIFKFKTLDRAVNNCTFSLHRVSEVTGQGAQKSKMYTLQCVSEEAFYARTNYVQNEYSQKLCSDIIKDIHATYLKSKKPIEVEDTRGPQTISGRNMNPYKMIDMVRRRSVSANNNSSAYVYFESRDDGQQKFKFTTIENLFTKESIKTFQQSDAINSDSLLAFGTDNNILAYRVPKQLSALDKISLGGPKRIASFNFNTWDFTVRTVNTTDTSYKAGGSGTGVSADFKGKYFDAVNPPLVYLPTEYASRPLTYLADTSADLMAYISLLVQNSMKIRVPGDSILTAGQVITCNIPEKKGNTDTPVNDPMLSGKFLISRIHHRIGMIQDKPRYTCIMECIKGQYEEGV